MKLPVSDAVFSITANYRIGATLKNNKNDNGFEKTKFNYMMNQKDWIEIATEFSLGNCIFYNRPVKIVARYQINSDRKWVLKIDEWVLGKEGEFHWEMMPSSRTDEFIENTRFNTPDECYSFWFKNVNAKKPLYKV